MTTEKFSYETENAVEIAKATLDTVDMDNVVRIDLEIERDDESTEPVPETADGGDVHPAHAGQKTVYNVDNGPDGYGFAHGDGEDDDPDGGDGVEEARERCESTINATYPILKHLRANGPTLTGEIDQELGYNASSMMSTLATAGYIKREPVSPGGTSRWMYLNAITDYGDEWFRRRSEPADAFPNEKSSPPREADIEPYKAAVTGNEFR